MGESPRAGGNPRLPLWPWPKTSSGGRLLDMSGMTLVTYLSRLARVNLAYEPVSRWNPTHARLRAQWIAAKMPKNSRILALGARVRDAFGIPEFFTPAPISDCGILVPPDWAQMVAIPHPSGRNLTYNEPEAREEARRWIRWTARLR